MEQEKRFNGKLPFLRKRCPHLSEKELEEAEELFIEYVKFVWDLCDELELEGKPIITEEERKLYLEDMKRLPKNPRCGGKSSNPFRA